MQNCFRRAKDLYDAIRGFIQRASQRAPVLFKITVILIVISVAQWALSIYLGLAWTGSAEAPGYIEKPNWGLQPLFWPILAFLVYIGWQRYQDAWAKLPSREVLWRGEDLLTNPGATEDFIERLNRKRPWLAVLAIVVGITLTVDDAGCLWPEYLDRWEDLYSEEVLSTRSSYKVVQITKGHCSEKDFSIAFKLHQFDEVGEEQKSINGWFVLVAYLLQAAIAAYALLALFQLIMQSYYFLRFERCRANVRNLEIRLNYRDLLCEFGLTDVNRAINITYIFIALAMLLPVLSAYANPVADSGQWVLRILVAFILLVPAAIPVFERLRRVREAGARMAVDPDPEAKADYWEQRLWPFEGTQVGYVGKLAFGLAIGMYIYLFTRDFSDIIK